MMPLILTVERIGVVTVREIAGMDDVIRLTLQVDNIEIVKTQMGIGKMNNLQ
jgi:hypothetical protein